MALVAGYKLKPSMPLVPSEDNRLQLLIRTLFPYAIDTGFFTVSFYGVRRWPTQGWKLHVSATAANACDVLSRAEPILKDFGVRFKVVSSLPNLLNLNGGAHGFTQIGKFITAYPSSNREAVQLANVLDSATTGLRGPRVPSDHPLRPGSLVYYRYGAFRSPTPYESDAIQILDSSGRLFPDHRLPYYTAPPWVSDPFDPLHSNSLFQQNVRPFLDRFLILSALNRALWGRVYDAIDLRAVPPRRFVVKEFWHDVALDSYGRDSTDHASLEAAVLSYCSSLDAVPRLLDFFERDGDTFLVIERVDGHLLSNRFKLGGADEYHATVPELTDIGLAIARALAELHAYKVIHRDVKPSNIFLTRKGTAKLIDLAFSYRLGVDHGPPIGIGTHGFNSPDEKLQSFPTPADDIFSWGATLYLLATGETPSIPPNHAKRASSSLRRARPDLPGGLLNLIRRSVASEPSTRPTSMNEIVATLEAPRFRLVIQRQSTWQHVRVQEPPLPQMTIDDCRSIALQAAIGLCRQIQERDGGLVWSSSDVSKASTRFTPDIYSGAAGVGLFLALMSASTNEPLLAETVEKIARWLASSEWGYGSSLCGLHAGEAGVGLFYLRIAKFLNIPAYVDMAVLRARRLEDVIPTTLDLVDGTAGWLVFLTEIAEVTGERRIKRAAVRLGNALLERAIPLSTDEEAIYWQVPSLLPGGPTQPYLGLLHGAAGIGFALLLAGARLNIPKFLNAAERVGKFLLATAVEITNGRQSVLYWPRILESGGRQFAAHCHGSGGIGQFLIRLWKYVESPSLVVAACRAADAVASRDPQNSSQCHGLAGDGSIFLDIYHATGNEDYLQQAFQVGARLSKYNVEKWPSHGWKVNAVEGYSPSYMTGTAGVAAFYSRLAEPNDPDLILC